MDISVAFPHNQGLRAKEAVHIFPFQGDTVVCTATPMRREKN